MWKYLFDWSRHLLLRDGVGIGSRSDVAAAARQYQQLNATSTKITEYYQKDQAGDVPKDIKTEATKDLLALSKSKELSGAEVATVKGILAKIEGGQELTDDDVKQLQTVVTRLQTRLLGEEKAAIASAGTSNQVLGDLAVEGVTPEVELAAIKALEARATNSTDPKELAKLLQPVGDPPTIIGNVQTAVAKNPHTSVRDLLKLAESSDPTIRAEAEKNLRGRGEELLAVFKDMDCGWTSDEEYASMRKLASLASPEIQAKMIDQLMDGYTSGDAEDCLRNIMADARAPLGSPPSAGFQDLVGRLDLDRVFDELDGGNLTEVRQWVGEGGAALAGTSRDPAVLKKLAGLDDPAVNQVLAGRVNVKPEKDLDMLLEKVAGSKHMDEATQRALVGNPKAPVPVIRGLVGSGLAPDIKASATAELLNRATNSKEPDDLTDLVEDAKTNVDILKALVANTYTPPEALRILADPAKSPLTDGPVQKTIALHAWSPPDLIYQISRTGLTEDAKQAGRDGMAMRASTGSIPNQLRFLQGKVNELAASATPADVAAATRIREELADNRNATPDVLRALADPVKTPSTDAVTQGKIADNPQAPVDVLQTLSNNPDATVKAKAEAALLRRAGHTNPGQLRQLAEVATNPAVLEAVAKNAATPVDALLKLADPAQPAAVRQEALVSLRARAAASHNPQDLRLLLQQAADTDVRKALAANPNTPPDVLLELADSAKVPQTDEPTQLALLANPGVTKAVLKKLKDGGATEAIKTAAQDRLTQLSEAGNRGTDSARLTTIGTGNPSREVARELLANPSTPDDVAAKLVVQDNRIEPGEIEALRKRVKDGHLTLDQTKTLLKNGGLTDAAAATLAGKLTASDEDFKKWFGLEGHLPVTIALKPALGGGLDIEARQGFAKPGKPSRMDPQVSLDPLRRPETDVQISGPVRANHDFPGAGSLPADTYTVKIHGKEVKVVLPRNGTTDGELPTLEQVVNALRLLPDQQLGTVKTIVLSPERNPDDEHWAVVKKKPHFRSAARGGDGEITIFPDRGGVAQGDLDSTLMHESGHTLAGKVEGSDGERLDRSADWKAAMATDGASASNYADTQIEDDFAETVSLYLMERDNPAVRAQFAARFKILDEIFAGTRKTSS